MLEIFPFPPSELGHLKSEEAFNQYVKTYLECFVRDYNGPYATQRPGQDWRTKRKKVSDPLIRDGHLEGKYWVALLACWYPLFGFLDVDHAGPDKWERIKEYFGFQPGEYLLFTSPSFAEDGNFHVYYRPRYRHAPATKKLLCKATAQAAVALRIEIYPQLRHKSRLPMGRDQHLIDEDTWMPMAYPWPQGLYWFLKMDDYDLARLPQQLRLPLSAAPVKTSTWRRQAEELLEHGLPGPGTRHDSIEVLAKYFFRCNCDPGEATFKIKHWLRTKHNGHSKDVNAGRWARVEREVDEIVAWYYAHYDRARFYPDSTHNLEGWVTPADVRWITQDVFPQDVVNQKRLFKLLCYYRARMYHDWVFIPWHRWDDIAARNVYKKFQSLLEAKGLLDSIHSYWHQEGNPEASYPKRFRLKNLPAVRAEQRIVTDGRAVQDYYDSLLTVYGSKKEVYDLVGRWAYYQHVLPEKPEWREEGFLNRWL